MDWIAFGFGLFDSIVGEIDILEEGTSASNVEWVGEFIGTNSADDVANRCGAVISDSILGKIFLDGFIKRWLHLTKS